ncbi:MAG: hypothetical protein IPP61_15485 [Cytophagaceae bacterium]|nr:hypothetical protein [Cytophagaceae bacterium]MBK9932580.1 hypothetical protein [Cytophagaceae bacterium]MBL0303736.1 hypothetical protein [Cytophagaceae bacterium]MBL0326559.1 hypothetical protein [Cytophagaceae bacterium]
MKILHFTSLFLLVGLTSCDLFDSANPDSKLGGDQSVIGEVGNTFSLGSISGVNGFKAEVKTLDAGVSDISASLTISDPVILEMAKSVPEFKWNGNTLSVTKKYRITEEGIQNVYDEGNFTLVKYDDKVGDSYSIKVDGKKITREVEYKSTTDDYGWGMMNIKVMKVGETGRPVAGVSKIEYILNHKFGVVGFKAYFEDGSSKEVRFFSKN